MIVGGAIALPAKSAEAWHDWKSRGGDRGDGADGSTRRPAAESTRARAGEPRGDTNTGSQGFSTPEAGTEHASLEHGDAGHTAGGREVPEDAAEPH